MDGLRLDGDGVVLSALKRRGEWLELRLVNERASTARATIHAQIAAAREADLLGRPGAAISLDAGSPLTLDLGPWEIRSVHVRVMP
jgi:alpha-mannosidase